MSESEIEGFHLIVQKIIVKNITWLNLNCGRHLMVWASRL